MSSIRARGAPAPSFPERGPVAAVAAVLEGVRASAAAANAACEQARVAHTAATAALSEAEAQYATDPDDGATVHSAERSLRLAEVRLDAAKKKQVEAARALEGAEAAHTAASLEAKRDALAELASPATIATAIADPWRVALAAFEALDHAVGKIKQALADSHRASSELRSIGVYVRDLDELHALIPAFDSIAERRIVIPDLNAVRLPVSGLTPTAVVGFLETCGAAQPSPHADSFRARLNRLKNTRTILEANELEEREAKEQSALAMSRYRAPSPTRPAGPVPTAPAPAALLVPSEPSNARRSSAPSRRHDE